VKQEGKEIPLIFMANATGKEGAVVIPLQNANVAQTTVPGPRWHQLLACGAVVPQVSLTCHRILSFQN